MKQSITLLSLLILMSGSLVAQQMTQRFTFSQNDLQIVQSNNYDVVKLNGTEYLEREEYAGQPQLPLKQFKLLLPQGTSAIDVSLIINSEQQITGSYYVYPVQLPVYLNFSSLPPFVEPDTAIYNSNNPFPADYIVDY